jgi:hypothetical protein
MYSMSREFFCTARASSSPVTSGFLFSAGTYTALNTPGPVQGINNAGQMVGWGNGHGYLWSGGSLTTLDVPGSFGAYPCLWD